MVRNLLALSEGIFRTTYWNLGPEVPGPVDPYILMHLLVGKLPLLDYRGATLAYRHPEAETFALFARELKGVERVNRVELADQPSVYVFRVERVRCEPLYVVWDRRDAFEGECEPPVRVTLPWQAATPRAIDAFGNCHELEIVGGKLQLRLTDAPLFVTATGNACDMLQQAECILRAAARSGVSPLERTTTVPFSEGG